MPDTSAALRSHRRRAAGRRPANVFGVLGEILITLGVVVLLYVAWQLWIGDAIIASERQTEARELSRQWSEQSQAQPATSEPAPEPDATAPPAPAEPIVPAQVGNAETFAILHIPRFGDDWMFPIAEGTSKSRVLDPIGIGHYPNTAMPGAVGNVALAAHRYTHGAPFEHVPTLRIGDAIVIETPDGWFTYRFRNLEYIRPSEVAVLEPVPQQVGAAPDGRYLTLTTCSPMWSTDERIAAYAVYESFTPHAQGEPESLVLAGGA